MAPDYLAQYQQAIADKAYDYARTIITSATQAARLGMITPQQVADFTAAVKANPPK